MYRDPDPTPPRCTSCGNSSLTPSTRFDTTEGSPCVHYRDTRLKPSWLDTDDVGGLVRLTVDRARVCLDCGHVMFALSEPHLKQLREAMGSFVAITD